MYRPEFSELQLQQAVNSAYCDYFKSKIGYSIFAHIPSLVEEKTLGWDTGFYIPFLTYAPLTEQKGCNFFLQYKLSNKLVGGRAKEWPYWKQEYFRFTIPHCNKDDSGKCDDDDYHQWESLEALARYGYPTYYATNSTIEREVLISQFEQSKLIENIPMLDVREVQHKHKHVTFTPDSNFFLMHSEIERVKKYSLQKVLQALSDHAHDKRSSLSDETARILGALSEIRQYDDAWRRDTIEISLASNNIDQSNINPILKIWMTRSLISSVLMKHTGIIMHWFPIF